MLRLLTRIATGVAYVGVCLFVVLAVAAVVGRCSLPMDQTSPNLACVHFMNMMEDVEAGRLTEDEILWKLEEVEGMSRGSGVESIAEASRLLLGAAELRSRAGVALWAGDMIRACEDLGWSRD